jgi:hypothetical protein
VAAASQNGNGDAKVEFVKAVVAAGRTVNNGKHAFGPGREVSLPAAEIDQLRARGFLVDPNAPKAARDNGPTFSPKSGPSIRVAA